MTPELCVRKIAGPVGKHGGAFMFDADAFARGAELGLQPWSWYHCGRGGVLGSCHASVAGAAFGFFPPHLQAKAWDKGLAVMPAEKAAEHYAQACAEHGRKHFDVPEAGRFADLLTKAVDAADPAGVPLFAGWRQKLHEGPSDAPGRLALALMAAREHRGGLHLLAVVAAGIPPLNAVMSGRYGATNAEFFGWPQPWPDPAEYAEQMAAVDVTTNELVQPAYEALTDDERAELVTGLRAMQA